MRRILLSADGCDIHPLQIHADNRTVRLGYFASQPITLLTAICAGNNRVDLRVVSPDVNAEIAEAAMAIAATTNNIMSAQQVVEIGGTSAPTCTKRLAKQVWVTDADDPDTIRPRTISPRTSATARHSRP